MSVSKQPPKRLNEVQDKIEDYQTPPEERPRKKKPSSSEERQALVERLIQEAMDRGEFDNLPGKGKPLRLNENPYLEPGQELAFGLLKNNGFAPEWIERDKDIRRELELARHQLERAWQLWQGNPAYESKWQQAVTQFEEKLGKLNHKIDDFNLIAPSVSVHHSRLRLENELQRVKNSQLIEMTSTA